MYISIYPRNFNHFLYVYILKTNKLFLDLYTKFRINILILFISYKRYVIFEHMIKNVKFILNALKCSCSFKIMYESALYYYFISVYFYLFVIKFYYDSNSVVLLTTAIIRILVNAN